MGKGDNKPVSSSSSSTAGFSAKGSSTEGSRELSRALRRGCVVVVVVFAFFGGILVGVLAGLMSISMQKGHTGSGTYKAFCVCVNKKRKKFGKEQRGFGIDALVRSCGTGREARASNTKYL